MTTDQDFSAQRRRLRVELRNERKRAHLTQKQVARAMDWSPSKMLRIETGAVGISVTDLRALLSYYSFEDKRQVAELVDLARAARTGGVRLMNSTHRFGRGRHTQRMESREPRRGEQWTR